ncbi:MAG: hypothetical protein JWM74_4136, partial [Myxococcaceae bacterium]|nr:hypothetical protein [Myxococcaceae bacterium]
SHRRSVVRLLVATGQKIAEEP